MLLVLKEIEKFIEVLLIIEYSLIVGMFSIFLVRICVIMLVFILNLIDKMKLYSMFVDIILLFIVEENILLLY